jgi:hypothetical protein
MSNELNDADCEKGHVTQRPPIPYATSKAESTMKASRETIKMKTPEGEVKVAVLGDSPDTKEYLQHLNAFLQMLTRKKYEDDLLKLTKTVGVATALVRKLSKAPSGEKSPEMAGRLKLFEAAQTEFLRAEVSESTKVGLIYELFRNCLKEDPELRWDRIIDDMHAKDPWEDLKGVKYEGLRRKSSLSLWECSISISSRYILSMQRRGRDFTCYVTSKSLQSSTFEHM